MVGYLRTTLDEFFDRLFHWPVRSRQQFGVPLTVVRPMDSVAQYLPHCLVVIGGIGLVSRSEVKDIPGSATVSQPGAKNLSALKPRDKDRLERLWHREW